MFLIFSRFHSLENRRNRKRIYFFSDRIPNSVSSSSVISPYRQRLSRFFRALSWHSRYFLCKSLKWAGAFLTVVQKPCERSISPTSSPFRVRVTWMSSFGFLPWFKINYLRSWAFSEVLVVDRELFRRLKQRNEFVESNRARILKVIYKWSFTKFTSSDGGFTNASWYSLAWPARTANENWAGREASFVTWTRARLP